jgi:hypothetical protein
VIRPGALLAMGLVSALPAPALACTYPLPEPIAGESQLSWNVRQEQFIRQWQEDGSRAWQRDLFDQASRISLARVVERRLDGEQTIISLRPRPEAPRLFEAELVPVRSLKGELPEVPVTVRWQQQMQCRFSEPGSAATAPVGTMVILFDGFAPGSFTGPEAFLASMARDPRLLAALKKSDGGSVRE